MVVARQPLPRHWTLDTGTWTVDTGHRIQCGPRFNLFLESKTLAYSRVSRSAVQVQADCRGNVTDG